MYQLILLAALTAPPIPYAQAYEATVTTQQPLIVMVGASWCGPCHRLRAILSAQEKPWAYVDVDKEPKLARRLLRGSGAVPQLWVWRVRSLPQEAGRLLFWDPEPTRNRMEWTPTHWIGVPPNTRSLLR